MGLGGALIWTGFAYNLKQAYPDKEIIFVYKRSMGDLIFKKPHPDHVVYQNNSDIDYIFDHITWYFKKSKFNLQDTIIVDMTNPAYSYYEKDTDERIFYKTGRHAIQIACDVHNMPNAELQPRIELSEEEVDSANRLLESHGLLPNQYICIEPHTKKEFTPNKAWFWENWQLLIDLINQYIHDNNLICKLVQIGLPADKVLNGVVELTGKTTFRETAQILKRAITFIGYVGGLTHLSKAVGQKSIVLVSAWEPLELASYPDDINFYTDIDCKNCGLKIPCPINRKCMQQITVEHVFEAAKSVLLTTLISRSR
jgi:ADP-heptose:LPS heptosyltransferase